MAYNIRIAGADLSFSCEAGQNILDAALKAGIEMPYSCRKGVCGNCAGGISEGKVKSLAATDVTPPGKHLYCQCEPLSDLEIQPEAWRRLDPGARKTLLVKVFRNTLAAPDVNVLQLRLPMGQRARFKAGQYLRVALPDGSWRCYSMANPPHESDMLQLHVRHVKDGRFTQIVQQLKAGDTLRVELPFGSFEMKEETPAPMICIAGGTGFAPVKSLLDDMARRNIRRPVTLIWCGRDRRSLYLMSAVERWASSLPDFSFFPVLEDAADAMQMNAIAGRADDAVFALFEDLAGSEVYCCGAPAMVAAVRTACVRDRRLDEAAFFSDAFVPGPAA